MFTFLLIVQTLVAVAMITVILMQRSEGGGLVSGGGGGGGSLMSARGAADFLTRSTAVLATIFVILSIALAGVAAGERTPRGIDPNLLSVPPAEQQPSPFTGAPILGTQPQPAQPAEKAPAEESGVPIAQ